MSVWPVASQTRVPLGTGIIVLLGYLARFQFDVVVPYLTLVSGGLFTFLLTGLVRFRSRLFSFKKGGEGPTMLVVGSGLEAAAFARRLHDIDGGGSFSLSASAKSVA